MKTSKWTVIAALSVATGLAWAQSGAIKVEKPSSSLPIAARGAT